MGAYRPFFIARVMAYLPIDLMTSETRNARRLKTSSQRDPLDKVGVTAFGETSVAQLTPVVQISAQYGKRDDLNIINSNGGFETIEDSMYSVSSGTSPIGLSSLNAKKQAVYKPGQGLVGRVSAVFDTPQPLTLQAAGLITSEDSLAFGYLGTDFGILRASGGVVEAQELTITTAGTGTVTIVVNNIGYDIPISGDVNVNAWNIAEYFRVNPAENYLITSNQNTVFFMNRTPGPQGVFTFTGGGAFDGGFVQIAAGVDVSIEITKQSEFNQDKASWLKPEFGNVYEIKFSYLGFSSIEFYIKKPDDNTLVLVHIYDYSGKSTPIVRNPTFRIGWVARNLGNGVNVTVSGASAMSANEGLIVNDNQTRAVEKLDVTATQTPVNMITMRNRFHFGGIINRATIKPTLLSLATDDNRGAIFSIYAGAVFGAPLDFIYLDKENSIVEYATDTVEVTGGRLIASFSVARNAPLNLASADFQTLIEPDEVFTVTAKTKTGGTGESMDATIVLLEDL